MSKLFVDAFVSPGLALLNLHDELEKNQKIKQGKLKKFKLLPGFAGERIKYAEKNPDLEKYTPVVKFRG
ncbi:hypothetical protein [Pseudomonas gessardii]|uniref:Uncharacterized protein n=1 Tax=Pseudomonas gessardii TaxID=78544 RepID=A0A7Y1MT49_9PSED|nr:hypothetical protein [Pseudomonas gessardii]NNA97889.1 hypothetical protein [Pseudomonas gessardii]